jgi:hypothetical protein
MLAKFVGEIAARHSKTARDFGLGAVGYFQRAQSRRRLMIRPSVAMSISTILISSIHGIYFEFRLLS